MCCAAVELIKHKKEISKLIKKVQTSKVERTERCVACLIVPHLHVYMYVSTCVFVYARVCGDVSLSAGELIRSLLIKLNCS